MIVVGSLTCVLPGATSLRGTKLNGSGTVSALRVVTLNVEVEVGNPTRSLALTDVEKASEAMTATRTASPLRTRPDAVVKLPLLML